MEQALKTKNSLSSGWMLVTGLFLLCLLGTGLTWWNYSQQVFSSAHGVIESTGTKRRILVSDLPARAYDTILPGHQAEITIGSNTKVMKGSVLSVTKNPATLVIKLPDATRHYTELTDGTECSVTVDTTIPPQEGNP